MSFLFDAQFHTGKNGTFNVLTYSSSADVVAAIGLFGSIPVGVDTTQSLAQVSNNGLFTSRRKKVFTHSSPRKVIHSADELLADFSRFGQSISKASFARELASGEFFQKRAKSYTNSKFLSVRDADLYLKLQIRGCWWLVTIDKVKGIEDGIRITSVYPSYAALLNPYRFEGLAFIVLEGVLDWPTHFTSPRSDETGTARSEHGVLLNLLRHELGAAQKNLLSNLSIVDFGGDSSVVLDSEYVEALTKVKVKTDRGGVDKDIQEGIQRSASRVLELKKEIGEIAKFSGERLSTDPFTPYESGSTASFFIGGDPVVEQIDICQSLLSLRGVYAIDSLTSMLYGTDKFSSGAAGARGVNTNILQSLALSTYANSILLYAPMGEADPLKGYDLNARLGGELRKEVFSWENKLYGASSLPILLSATSRTTNRDLLHKISAVENGKLVIDTRVAGGFYSGETMGLVSLDDESLMEVVDVNELQRGCNERT